MRRRIGDPFQYYLKHYPGLTRGEVKRIDPTEYSRLHKTRQIEKLPRKDGKLPSCVRDKLDVFFTKEGYKDPNFLLPPIYFRTGGDGKKHVCTFHINGRRHFFKPAFGLPYIDIELRQLYFDRELKWILGAYRNNEVIKAWKINPPDSRRLLSSLSSVPSLIYQYKIGQAVIDERHGVGIVTNIDPLQQMVTVYFKEHTYTGVRGERIRTNDPLRISYKIDGLAYRDFLRSVNGKPNQ